MGQLGFPKTRRLRKRAQFLDLGRRGKKVENRLFIGIFAKNRQQESRLGVTVTRKVGNACVRNRIKRQARELFRHGQPDSGPCYDINIIAKAQAGKTGKPRLRTELEGLFKKLEKVLGS